MSSTPLPTECFLEIIKYVNSRDVLHQLVCVNHQFREITLPFLYRTVSLCREQSVRQFCRTLEKGIDLARLVDSFSIASSASPDDEYPEFLHGIHVALKNMVFLTDLSIRLIEQPPYQNRHWIFENTTFQLRRLELRMDYDSALISFLMRQPALQSLTLLGAVPDHLSSLRLELPPSALPQLSHFHGHYTQALALVPGRAVKSLHITQVDDTGDFEPSDVFVCLRDTVDTIARSQNAEILEELTVDDEDGDYGLLEFILSSIPTIKSITLFVPQHGHSWRRYSSPEWPTHLRKLVENKPISLERLNTNHDGYARQPLAQLAPLPVLPIFQYSRYFPRLSGGRAGFHNSIWFGAGEPQLMQEYTIRNWKATFPALVNVPSSEGSNS
ncbi:hypothetical protein RhiJN_23152 [Ceratobasidium sp. AG-Ba]|nr:hypothetical protein RhiJN_23152 [Ceratobasidium sp. AG-Ba]